MLRRYAEQRITTGIDEFDTHINQFTADYPHMRHEWFGLNDQGQSIIREDGMKQFLLWLVRNVPSKIDHAKRFYRELIPTEASVAVPVNS